MRHFAYLSDDETERLFAVPPQPVTPASPAATLALALGATLYAPGTRPNLVRDAQRAASIGATSMVWCLEDAIPHAAVPEAELNVVAALRDAWDLGPDADLPLLFVRVRDAEQVRRIAAAAGEALEALTGFSLPKITPANAVEMLSAVADVSAGRERPIYAMPILETPDLAWLETRRTSLLGLSEVFGDYRDNVLCVRIGGTDLSGLFGLRRDRDTTIWDVAVVRDCISDVINVFARLGHHVVTGVVWEHIPGGDRLFKPQLRATPFQQQHETALRQQMVKDDTDELLREVALDRANGLHGKTVIHPSHVAVVNAMLTVSREEYDDALAIMTNASDGGVAASAHGRMNEMGPHALWAEMISRRAAVYGVLSEEATLVDLLSAGKRRANEVYNSTSGAAPANSAALPGIPEQVS